MTALPEQALYMGRVWHKRFRPKVHAFKYPIFYLLLDLDTFENKAMRPKGLSLNRFGLFSLYQRDYGNPI